MLSLAGDDVVALALVRIGNTFHRQVHRFCAARSKENIFGRFSIDQSSELTASSREGIANLQAVLVQRRWVAECLHEVWAHRLKHFRKDRRGGLVIEKYVAH